MDTMLEPEWVASAEGQQIVGAPFSSPPEARLARYEQMQRHDVDRIAVWSPDGKWATFRRPVDRVLVYRRRNALVPSGVFLMLLVAFEPPVRAGRPGDRALNTFGYFWIERDGWRPFVGYRRSHPMLWPPSLLPCEVRYAEP